MSRDWTPAEHYLNEQQQIQEGYGDIFHFMENLKIKYTNGKEELVYSSEEMTIRRQFPMLGKLLGYGFIGLYEKLFTIPGGIDFLHEKDRELGRIVETKEADENSYLFKWFVGKLDERFYYSERNNELFCANVLTEAQLLTGRVWVTVYKDALGIVDDEDNLTEILVPSDWLIKQLKFEGIEDFVKWFSEYTADDTDFLARCALAESVILDCEDKQINIARDAKLDGDILVRPLSETFAEQVKVLDYLSGNNVACMVDSPEYAWGVFVGNELVGYCTIGGADDPDVGYEDFPAWDFDSLCLSDVFIKEEYRGKGLASRLVNGALEECNSNFPKSVFITVLDDKLCRLYEQLGFKYLDNGVMVREKSKAPSLENQINDARQPAGSKVEKVPLDKELER